MIKISITLADGENVAVLGLTGEDLANLIDKPVLLDLREFPGAGRALLIHQKPEESDIHTTRRALIAIMGYEE